MKATHIMKISTNIGIDSVECIPVKIANRWCGVHVDNMDPELLKVSDFETGACICRSYDIDDGKEFARTLLTSGKFEKAYKKMIENLKDLNIKVPINTYPLSEI